MRLTGFWNEERITTALLSYIIESDTTPVLDTQVADAHMLNRISFNTGNACDYTSASEGVKIIQMLGYSMKAVALPKGGVLTFEFEVEKEGDYDISTMLIPTQPTDGDDLRYRVAVDDALPVSFSLKEPFRSEHWKDNVLSGQAVRHLRQHLQAGRHLLTICAVDSHIVVDQWSLKMTD